jgi:excisionase family DNA binding protein
VPVAKNGNGPPGALAEETGAPLASPQLTRVSEAVITVSAPTARLLSLRNAARYLGVSTWTIRDLMHRDLLKPTMIPGRTRMRIDRADLDLLIPTWKPQ